MPGAGGSIVVVASLADVVIVCAVVVRAVVIAVDGYSLEVLIEVDLHLGSVGLGQFDLPGDAAFVFSLDGDDSTAADGVDCSLAGPLGIAATDLLIGIVAYGLRDAADHVGALGGCLADRSADGLCDATRPGAGP
jgi:hypothetical protein